MQGASINNYSYFLFSFLLTELRRKPFDNILISVVMVPTVLEVGHHHRCTEIYCLYFHLNLRLIFIT